MSLIFSLSAVLAATILQQWVRDYTQIFHLYYDPLIRARACQFLYEGTIKWRIRTVVNIIPALVHISLFLFFFGLTDFLFHINLTVGITTIITVALCGIFYVFCTFAPLISHQSPYHTPLTVFFWWPLQSFRPGGKLGQNALDAHVQFAARTSPEEYRRDRDARALAWTIASASEEGDSEDFLRTVPRSLSNDWGVSVWQAANLEKNRNPAYFDREFPIDVIRRRIDGLLLSCIDPGMMQDEGRAQRIQTCIDAAVAIIVRLKDDASLWFGEDSVICETLASLAGEEKDHKLAFMLKSICLMAIALKQALHDDRITQKARDLITTATKSEQRPDFDRMAKDMVYLIDNKTNNMLSLVPDLRKGPFDFDLSVSQDPSWQSWRLEDISNSGIVFTIEVLICALASRGRVPLSSRYFIEDTIRSFGLESSSINQQYLQALIDRVRSPELSSLSFLSRCLEVETSPANSTKELGSSDLQLNFLQSGGRGS